MVAQALVARLMAQVLSAQAPAVRAPERLGEPEQAQEPAQTAWVPAQPGAAEARAPLQVEAALQPGAALGVGQESARAG